jgi:hypothetical protein
VTGDVDRHIEIVVPEYDIVSSKGLIAVAMGSIGPSKIMNIGILHESATLGLERIVERFMDLRLRPQ